MGSFRTWVAISVSGAFPFLEACSLQDLTVSADYRSVTRHAPVLDIAAGNNYVCVLLDRHENEEKKIACWGAIPTEAQPLFLNDPRNPRLTPVRQAVRYIRVSGRYMFALNDKEEVIRSGAPFYDPPVDGKLYLSRPGSDSVAPSYCVQVSDNGLRCTGGWQGGIYQPEEGGPLPLETYATPEGEPIADVTVGVDYFCVLTAAATLYCRGRNGHGQLGEPVSTANAPYHAVELSKYVKSVLTSSLNPRIFSGPSGTCLVAGREVVCVGGNTDLYAQTVMPRVWEAGVGFRRARYTDYSDQFNIRFPNPVTGAFLGSPNYEVVSFAFERGAFEYSNGLHFITPISSPLVVGQGLVYGLFLPDRVVQKVVYTDDGTTCVLADYRGVDGSQVICGGNPSTSIIVSTSTSTWSWMPVGEYVARIPR